MRPIDADALIAEIEKDYCQNCPRRKRKNEQVIFAKTGRYMYQIGGLYCKDCSVTVYDMIAWIETSDTIKEKTGKWIDDNCSVCGQYVHHGDARNYCPNCGAKMNR